MSTQTNDKIKRISKVSLKTEKTAYHCARIAFGTVFAIIFIVLLFPKEAYRYKKDFLLSNGWMFAIIATLFLFFAAASLLNFQKRRRALKSSAWNVERMVVVATVALFFWQCYVAYNIFLLSGWDVQMIMDNALKITNGRGYELYWPYFSRYSNNLFMTYFFAMILKIGYNVGIFAEDYIAMNIVVINCLINSFACYLVYQTAALFVEKKTALKGYCLGVLSFGLSAWNVICYSDALTLFVPVLSAYLYLKPCKIKCRKTLYRIAAVWVSMLGYYIKPQCAITLIAIMLVEAVRLLQELRIKKAISFAALCMTIVLTSCCTNALLDMGTQKLNGTLDQNARFGAPHFLMMGLNEKDEGGYSQEDVDYSSSFDTNEERMTGNLSVVRHRIQQMGIGGLLNHFHTKLLTAFNDGTFAWGYEGNFYLEVPEDINRSAAPLLKDIYYNDHKYYNYLATIQQFVWLTVLLFASASALRIKKQEEAKPLSVLWLTALGFVAYELLFEVRARYVYIFVPIFCVLAAVGLDNALKLTIKKWKRSSERVQST